MRKAGWLRYESAAPVGSAPSSRHSSGAIRPSLLGVYTTAGRPGGRWKVRGGGRQAGRAGGAELRGNMAGRVSGRGGTRTRTGRTPQEILSLSCLPVPPRGRDGAL